MNRNISCDTTLASLFWNCKTLFFLVFGSTGTIWFLSLYWLESDRPLPQCSVQPIGSGSAAQRLYSEYIALIPVPVVFSAALQSLCSLLITDLQCFQTASKKGSADKVPELTSPWAKQTVCQASGGASSAVVTLDTKLHVGQLRSFPFPVSKLPVSLLLTTW